MGTPRRSRYPILSSEPPTLWLHGTGSLALNPQRGHSLPLVSRLDARWLGSSFHFLTLK